nr:triple gene block protein 2 [Sweet potato chlorotic fleck virus]
MSLTPPADYSKSVLAFSIGCGIAVIIFVTTRSTLPYVGDGQHSLPHGGTYCDAAKRVIYGKPSRGAFDWLYTSGSASYAIPLILCLTLLIYCLSPKPQPVCHRCGLQH